MNKNFYKKKAWKCWVKEREGERERARDRQRKRERGREKDVVPRKEMRI